MYRFLNRAGRAGVVVSPASSAAPKSCVLTFTPELPGPCTISTAEPFRGPGVFGFTVVMPTKNARTAIGFMGMEPPDERYMTPDYITATSSGSSGTAKGGYVSMGGAGFIYPFRTQTGVKYGQGDSIRCVLDFDTRIVTFAVNGVQAGTGKLPDGCDGVYAAISSEGGLVVCDTKFD